MPMTRIIVRNVTGPYRLGLSGYAKFDVDVDGGQYGTFDPFVASLCDQAEKQGFQVDVTWRETRFGREIVKGGARKAEAAA